MPRVEIPGVGVVEFPDSMDDAAISAAAAELHSTRGKAPASAEAFAPAPKSVSLLDSLTGRDGGPSTRGFLERAAQGASDVVGNLPRVLRGLTKINPAEIPGQIAEHVRDRVRTYADDGLGAIYDDPLSFLGDAATVAGIGAAASAPLRAGARAVSSAASAAAPAFGEAGAIALDVAGAAAKEAVKSKLTGRSATMGAVRGARGRLLDRALQRAAKAPGEAVEAAAGAVDDLPAGYDRYMPNTSAGRGLPPEFSPDMPPPASRAAEQLADAADASRPIARPPAASSSPAPAAAASDAQVVEDLIRQMESNLSRVPRSKRLAAPAATTDAEVDALIEQMNANLRAVPQARSKIAPRGPIALLPEISQTSHRAFLKDALGVDFDVVEEAMRSNSPDVLAGRVRPRYR